MRTYELKGYCKGPFDIVMKEDKAKRLEDLIKKGEVKEEDFVRTHNTLAPTQRDKRTDVSWITVEEPDNAGDLLITKSLDLSLYNNLVTVNHKYEGGGVGRSLWQKPYSDATREGIIAKTHYPPKPDYLTDKDQWLPDSIWAMIDNGLLLGKSAGVIAKPNGLREPSTEERERFPGRKLTRVIDGAYLVEYACCSKPVAPRATVVEIHKAMPDMPKEVLAMLELPELPEEELIVKSEEIVHKYGISIEDINAEIKRRLDAYDIGKRLASVFDRAIAKSQGRV